MAGIITIARDSFIFFIVSSFHKGPPTGSSAGGRFLYFAWQYNAAGAASLLQPALDGPLVCLAAGDGAGYQVQGDHGHNQKPAR